MGQPVLHKKVKLIIGFIFENAAALKNAEALILKNFGVMDLESPVLDFSHTGYYKKEFGENLKRKFVSVKRLRNSENIYRVKLLTNDIERKLSQRGKRTINIDPGYLTEGKLALLTTKDHGHRIYLRGGIYAESTLRFRGGTYRGWETTYPDYKTDDYIKIFNDIRALYKEQLKEIA